MHHRGKLGIDGNADEPDGVVFTDDRGRVLGSCGRATPPGDTPLPNGNWVPPGGERLDPFAILLQPGGWHDRDRATGHGRFDCNGTAALATFWAAVLGGSPDVRDPAWAAVRDSGGGVVVAFQRVPEPKALKNRLHFDVEVTELAEATAACVRLGAEAVGPVVHDEHGSFQVMVDPEGNEFCLVT